MGYFQGGEFFDGMGPPQSWGEIVISDQQQGGNAGFGKAYDPATPFPLEGRCRLAILVGVPGEEDYIDFLLDSRVDDGI